MKTQIDLGIFSYCGTHDLQSHLIYDVEGDHKAPNRQAGLAFAARIAQEFISPDRIALDVHEEHLRGHAAAASAH